jgi:CubicO group peptidase (beta-lactamase class C family)
MWRIYAANVAQGVAVFERMLSVCFALALMSAPASAAPNSLEKHIDSYLAPLLRTNNFSGTVLVAKGDKVLLQKGYGKANIEHDVSNSASTVFQIASVSKPFTAAAVMLLSEQGKLDLKAPLTAVLPDYPQGKKLTIHHLLTHTSGIPNINDFDEYGDIQRRPHTPEQLVAHFKDKSLEFEPGAQYGYSNSNYNLLALIIEKASGQDYGSFLASNIFGKLGLKQAGHHASAAQIIPLAATGYAAAGATGLERATYIDWSVKTGNGSLYSDAASVARFLHSVHAGRLLAPGSLAAAFTPHTPNVGYGWFLTKANGREIHHANGRSPGFAAQADYYVKDGVSVVVLSNTYVSVTTDIARAIGALYFGGSVKPMPALKPDRLTREQVASLVGKYQFGPDYYVPNALMTVRERGDFLETAVGDYVFPLVQISSSRFLMRSFWIIANFTIGADGKATKLVIDGRPGVRVADDAGR